MLSTGMSKKPWIWSACRSIVSTRATPTEVSMLATTLALIATRAERGRRSWRGAAEVAGVAEVRDRRRDARRRRALERVDHHQHFHQVVVGRRAGRLQHEDVLAPHVLEQLDHPLAIGELADDRAADRQVEMLRHVLREARVGIAREHHQAV